MNWLWIIAGVEVLLALIAWLFLRARNAAMQKYLADKTSTLDARQQRIDLDNEAVKKLTSNLDCAKAEWNKTWVHREQVLAEENASIDRFKSDVDLWNLAEADKTLRKNIKAHKQKLEDFEADLTDAQEELLSVQTEIEAAKAERDKVQEQVAAYRQLVEDAAAVAAAVQAAKKDENKKG